MISTQALAIAYGIGSALAWGTGDFTAGVASRKNGVLSVLLFSQMFGALLLFSLAYLLPISFPPLKDMMLGSLAGVVGPLGLMALYTGFARGRIGIVAPLSAIITALIPIGVAFIGEGLPSSYKVLGLMLGLVSVWLLSYSSDHRNHFRFTEFSLPLLAGICFGLFFVLIDMASHVSVLWPLVGTRCTSLLIVSMLFFFNSGTRVPAKNQIPIIAFAGICDVLGNMFFALATHTGRLDISATLSSLYPAATVFLAWVVLKERLVRQQWLGVLMAFVALVLIAT